MKKHLIRLATALLALILLMQPALAADTTAADMADYLVEAGVVSLQYALVDDGQMVASETAGRFALDDEAAPTADTLYGVGSVSKMLTTAVVMQLVDQGTLALDEPVVSYIPEFEMADGRYRDITVRHLLNHSSGLPGSTWPGAVLWEEGNRRLQEGFLELLRPLHLKADPGAYSVYCNDGFTLAELVCERVTGRSFTALIHAGITGPLGLEHTYTPHDDFDRAALARTYLADGTQTPAESFNAIGTGGVYSTAEDLATLGQLFAGRWDHILSPEAQAATMVPEYQNGMWLEDIDYNILGYGLGWDSVDLYPFSRYGIRALCKGGDSILYHASLVVLPDHGLSAAVVTSGGDSTSNMMLACQLLLERLAETGQIDGILDDLPPLADEAVPLDVSVAGRDGLYCNALMSYQVTFEEDGTLVLAVPIYGEDATQRFAYVGDGRWQDATFNIELWFVQQAENDALYLVQSQIMEVPGYGQTVMAQYVAQQAPPYTPDADTLAAWTARNGALYMIVNEPYNSVAYTALPAAAMMIDPQNPGYMNVYRLEDADTLMSWVQVPINLGRDWAEIRTYTVDGVDYMSMRGYVMMSMAAVTDIWGGSRSICTIGESGHARWYTVGAELEGRTLTVTCPEKAGFALYDPNGTLVNQSALTGDMTVTVPQGGGYMVFAGEAGAVMEIAVSEAPQAPEQAPEPNEAPDMAAD